MSKPMSDQMQKVAARYEKATGKKFGQMTNAQHIRSMTDEELEQWLVEWCKSAEYCYNCPLDYCPIDNGMSFLDWLKQPYKEDT